MAAALDATDPERLELSIAAVNTAGEYIVSPMLRALRRQRPQVDIRLEQWLEDRPSA